MTDNISSDYGGGLYTTGGVLNLTNVAVTNNDARSGGGIGNSHGQLSVVNSTVNGNNATETGSTQIGGGILSQVSATTHILRSTVSGNQATGNGGGIANVGGSSLVVTDSTISGNSSTDGNGGGISHADTGTTASLVNVTVTDNHAGGGSGAGIQNDGDAESVSFLNTIIAGQTSAEPDCGPGSNSAADAFNSQGYNLDSDGSCGLEVSASDLPSANADLDPLGDYGGPTQTHQLQSTSDAIDAGDSDTCSASYDKQHGCRLRSLRPARHRLLSHFGCNL